MAEHESCKGEKALSRALAGVLATLPRLSATGEGFQSGNDFVVVSEGVRTHRFKMIGDLLESQRSAHTPLRRLALDLLGCRNSLDVSVHVSSLRVGGDFRTNTPIQESRAHDNCAFVRPPLP